MWVAEVNKNSYESSKNNSFFSALCNCSDTCKSTYLPPYLWDETPVQEVKTLPHNIDGHFLFKLPCDPQNLMKSSIDGRPWKPYVTSSRKGFNGIRRTSSCKGSYTCDNLNCSFFIQFKKFNKYHLKKVSDKNIFDSCGKEARYMPCDAGKFWEFPRKSGSDHVLVYHHGKHSCPAVMKYAPNRDNVTSVFEKNSKKTASHVQKKAI